MGRIKNEWIKHWIIGYWDGNPKRMNYICNGACTITPEKVAKTPEDVICPNCIRILKKDGVLK